MCSPPPLSAPRLIRALSPYHSLILTCLFYHILVLTPVYSLFKSSWSRPLRVGSGAGPSGVCDHISVWLSDTVLLFQHGNDADGVYHNQQWALDVSDSQTIQWKLLQQTDVNNLSPALLAPIAFNYHLNGTTVYTPYQFGGKTEDSNYNCDSNVYQTDIKLDQWKYSNGTVYTSGPLTSVLLPSVSTMIIPPSSLAAPRPDARAWAAVAALWPGAQYAYRDYFPWTAKRPPRSKFIMIGGTTTNGADSNEFWLYDATLNDWSQLSLTPSPANLQFPPASGLKTARIDGTLYIFGGYLCTTDSITSSGGTSCFSNTIYRVGIDPSLPSSYLHMNALTVDDASTQQQEMWPSPRAWHTMVAWKQYLIIYSGYFIDFSATPYWYDDVHMFDTIINEFISVSIRGNRPHTMWSSTLDVVIGGTHGDGELLLFGGCTSQYYNTDVYILKLGQYIQANNCSVSGPGLQQIIAGQATWFLISTIDPSGQPLSWGEGLVFDIFALGTDGITLIPGRVDTTVVELGGGQYNVSFTASAGTKYGCQQLTSAVEVQVRLDGQLLPGAPYSVPVIPTTLAPSSSYVRSHLSSGPIIAVQAKQAQFHIATLDQYDNSILISSNSSYNNAQYANVNTSFFTIQINNASVPYQLSSTNDGILSVKYNVPDAGSFLLSVSYNGQSLKGSPYTVSTISNLDIPAPLNLAIIALAALGSAALAFTLFIVFYFRNDPRIRASSPTFLSLIVFGCQVGVASLFVSVTPTVAGGISTASCVSYAWLLGFGFTITFSALMVKTWRIGKIFNSRNIQLVKLPDSELIKPVILMVILELIFNIVWYAVDTLGPVEESSSNNSNVHYTVCSSNRLQIWHGITFFSKCIVVIWAVKLSSAVRKAPGVFNESSAIGFSINNIALCGVVIIPLVFFGALNESQTALYVLKSIITLWCFVFTPLIIIYPKFFEHDAPPSAPTPGTATARQSVAGSTDIRTRTHYPTSRRGTLMSPGELLVRPAVSAHHSQNSGVVAATGSVPHSHLPSNLPPSTESGATPVETQPPAAHTRTSSAPIFGGDKVLYHRDSAPSNGARGSMTVSSDTPSAVYHSLQMQQLHMGEQVSSIDDDGIETIPLSTTTSFIPSNNKLVDTLVVKSAAPTLMHSTHNETAAPNNNNSSIHKIRIHGSLPSSLKAPVSTDRAEGSVPGTFGTPLPNMKKGVSFSLQEQEQQPGLSLY